MGIMRVFIGAESDYEEYLDECEVWGLRQKQDAALGECEQLAGLKTKPGH
jgi:hypothetical protein